MRREIAALAVTATVKLAGEDWWLQFGDVFEVDHLARFADTRVDGLTTCSHSQFTVSTTEKTKP
jgi:hypothetical protein